MLLYHGSDVAVVRPDVTRNTGLADLGHGFYLTDDCGAARTRADSRARRSGQPKGVVSSFEFDMGGIEWRTYGEVATHPDRVPHPLALMFADDPAGIVSWIDCIAACRSGRAAVAGRADPAIIRAWVATEEVEMACSGLCSAVDVAPLVDPASLVVQYCFRDQRVLDSLLRFAGVA